MSAVTMGLYYHIIPYTHHLLRAMVFNDAEELLYSMLKKARSSIATRRCPTRCSSRACRAEAAHVRCSSSKDEHGQIDIVAHAREAELRVDMARKLLLHPHAHGVATSEDGSRVYFEDRV